MKKWFKNYRGMALLVFFWEFLTQLSAQTFTVLHSFSAAVPPLGTNSDGMEPNGGLIVSGKALYGTCYGGGSFGYGTVFGVSTDGTRFATLHSFTNNQIPNTDGCCPSAGLVLSGTTLFGTTVFAVNTDGSGFATLQALTLIYPSKLVISDNTLYGTVQSGTLDVFSASVFKVNSDGTGFSYLYSFPGSRPNGLTLSSNTLYGTTFSGWSGFGGGSGSNGVLFKVNLDGSGFATLYSFLGGSDGANPAGPLTLSGNTLFGTAAFGGQWSNGVVFKVNLDGSGFTTLYSFSGGSDGASPRGELTLAGDTLYGITGWNYPVVNGTIFALSTNGTGFRTLHTFTGGADGSFPTGLALSANTLYGTAQHGGSFGGGTVFSISLPPRLTITPSADNIILTWPTNATGSALEFTTTCLPQFGLPIFPHPSLLMSNTRSPFQSQAPSSSSG